MAVRLVGWAEHRGRLYRQRARAPSSIRPPDITINNAALVEDNYNDVDTIGGRAALRIDLNENWTITPTRHGPVPGQQRRPSPTTRALATSRSRHFRPDYATDKWWQAALTIEGKIGNLDVTYAGAVPEARRRRVRWTIPTTRSSTTPCYGYGAYWYDDAGELVDPSQYIKGNDRYNKDSHELRFTTPRGEPPARGRRPVHAAADTRHRRSTTRSTTSPRRSRFRAGQTPSG